MAYNLIEATDQHMVRPKVHLPRNKYFYPSESSVRWIDSNNIPRVSGSCLRASYYRVTGERGLPTDPYSEWIFRLGKKVEEILVEEWKQMGIWVTNNAKFYDQDHRVSGEIDVVLVEPDTNTLFGVECKSFYGYYATKEICGSRNQAPRPKTAHLLQTLIYTDLCKRHGILDYFKLIYYARDSAKRSEFNIDIIEDNGLKRPTINGVMDYRFTVDEIYDRFEELNTYINNNQLPPADFELRWDANKVQTFFDLGEVSKTAFQDFQKNPEKNPVGDWQCRYCAFKNHCWAK